MANLYPNLIYLGHAAFLYQTSKFIILMDPWLDANGAYFNSWYQFPCNHHLQEPIISLFERDSRSKYIYISHHDKDHLDVNFLKKINHLNVKLLIPNFSRKDEITAKLTDISKFNPSKFQFFDDYSSIKIFDHELKFYIQDSDRESDSSILVKSKSFNFLNTNDCKLHDRIPSIIKEEGPIDFLTMQFSGASWHPVTYKDFYKEEKYNSISIKKKLNRFKVLSKTIEISKIRNYIPSAGPPCFLDPELFNINFEKNNIFPSKNEISDYLKTHNKNLKIIDINPGDKLSLQDLNISNYYSENTNFIGIDPYKDKKKYLEKYQKVCINNFTKKYNFNSKEILDKFFNELRDKISLFNFTNEVKRNLYFKIVRINNIPKIIRVDFVLKEIKYVENTDQENFYLVEIKEKDLFRYINDNLNFHDFLLSCKQKMARKPDEYDYLIDSFMCLDQSSFKSFRNKHTNFKLANIERINVNFENNEYEIDRYCPHENADLKHGIINEEGMIICPRHCWEFDLNNNGICKRSPSFSINSRKLELKNKNFKDKEKFIDFKIK